MEEQKVDLAVIVLDDNGPGTPDIQSVPMEKKKRVHVMTPARQAAFKKACEARKTKVAERQALKKITQSLTGQKTEGTTKRRSRSRGPASVTTDAEAV